MYKHLLFILCLCFQTSIFCQLTIQVNSIPANTPAEDDIYIAGNFNGWNSGSNDYILTENNGIYTITINPSPGLVEFKFTRGSWESVEGNENGGFQGFSLSYSAPNDAEAERAFQALAEGGTVTMPLTKTFWTSKFGMLTDKFGVGWMVVAGPKNP